MYNFVLPTPALEHLAGVKIVAHLLSQRDILTQSARSFQPINVLYYYEEAKKWKAIEENVQGKISSLPIPTPCQKPLFNLIKPLGMEIVMWCRYHYKKRSNYQFSESSLPPQLCWMMHGTVDYTKTAELMVKDERMDVERRYEIACLNCLEDEARQLIKLIPEGRKQEIINTVRYVKGLIDHSIFIVYFTCALMGKLEHSNCYFQRELWQGQSIYKCVFKVMLRSGSRASCDYFFKRLNQREKEQVLDDFKEAVVYRNRGSPTCGLLYCMSQMNGEEDVCDVLKCFLLWPMQSLFLAAAERGWRFLDKHASANVLDEIVVKIGLAYKDYDYCRLFWECWRMSSAECKQEFLRNSYYLVLLIETKEEEFIRLILNEGDLCEILSLFNKNGIMSHVLMDERVISDAALMECKQTAALNTSNEQGDVGKRLRSQHLSELIDIAMESRSKSREKCRCI